MTIGQIMSPFPHSLSPEHSIVAAHRLMQRHNVRHLPVLDEGRLMGVVSQRDLYFIESLTNTRAEDVSVSEAMQSEVITMAPTTPVVELAKTMLDKRVGSVVVVENDKVVGICTIIDALQILHELTTLEQEILDSGK